MSRFSTLPQKERALYIGELAARRGISTVIVEKDFWVVWTLGHLFALPSLQDQLVFKGGTSLSKVFGAIDRFSEDIDLSISPALVGFDEIELDEAPSTSQRQKRMVRLESKSIEIVKDQMVPLLEMRFQAELGKAAAGNGWLIFQIDEASHSPVVLFQYPQAVSATIRYIPKVVKIEFGSLTDQRPVGVRRITPLVAELGMDLFEDFSVEVVALEMERTFWEKATILHAEYHRPKEKPMRDRFSRHYSDFAALWQYPGRNQSQINLDLLKRVVLHKSRFFASSWAKYELAKQGTLRLFPPDYRIAELKADYEKMSDMFLSPPPPFDSILATVREAEAAINKSTDDGGYGRVAKTCDEDR